MRIVIGTFLLACTVLAQAGPAQPANKPDSRKNDTPSLDTSPATFNGKSMAQWIKDLNHEDPSIRTQAVIAIPEFGDRAAEAVPALLQRLQDKDVSPRARAVMALKTMAIQEVDVPRVVNALARRISPKEESQACVRYEAYVALRRFTGDASPAIPAIISGTVDRSSWEIRYLATALLWRVAQQSKEGSDPRATEALLQLLRWDKTYQVRLETLQGLGALGRPNDPMLLSKVVSELNLCARHQNKPLALWAYAGLVAMQDGQAAKSSLDALAKFLKNDSLEVRVQAAQALGMLRDRAKSKLPLLLSLLQDPEPVIVQSGCNALGMLGDKSDQVVSALVETLGHKDRLTAASAVIALVNLKVATSSVMTTLDRMLEKKDLDLRLRGLIHESIKELKKPAKK